MFWQEIAGGYRLRLRLTPKSSRDALGAPEILADGMVVLRAHVRAVPEDGKANDALIKVLSKALDVPRSAIELESGATSRLKVFNLRGGADVGAKLASLAEK